MREIAKKRTKEILHKIRKRRIEKEYSQEYVGIQLGIGQVAYHKLENGKTRLRIDTLLQLATILDVNATYFLEE
tara:strand:+ start:414 stop:635 length:222 start_codon:yes stop_codon:yes gene_type:complete